MQFTAQQIAAVLGGTIYGNAEATVHDVAPIENATEGRLSFVCEEKYLPLLDTTGASIVLITSSLLTDAVATGSREGKATLIAVENARGAMAQLLKMVAEVMNPRKQGIEQPAFVSEGVEVPADAYIGAFAYIGKNVRFGQGVQIYPQTYIGDNVQIGDNTILYAGVKIYANCKVGND